MCSGYEYKHSYLGVWWFVVPGSACGESGHERENQYKHGGQFNSWSHHQSPLICALKLKFDHDMKYFD